MRALSRFQRDEQIEIPPRPGDSLAHLNPLRGHGIKPAVWHTQRFLGLPLGDDLFQVGIPARQAVLRQMRRHGGGDIGQVAVCVFAQGSHDLFGQVIRLRRCQSPGQVAGRGDRLAIDVLNTARGLIDALEHLFMRGNEAQKPVHGHRRRRGAQLGGKGISQAAQVIGEGAGLVPFNETPGPRQAGKPPVDQLGNRHWPGLAGQRCLDLPPEPGVALGLVQHQLRELLGAGVFQLVGGKRGLASHGCISVLGSLSKYLPRTDLWGKA